MSLASALIKIPVLGGSKCEPSHTTSTHPAPMVANGDNLGKWQFPTERTVTGLLGGGGARDGHNFAHWKGASQSRLREVRSDRRRSQRGRAWRAGQWAGALRGARGVRATLCHRAWGSFYRGPMADRRGQVDRKPVSAPPPSPPRLEQRCVSARLWDEKSWFPSPFQSSTSTALEVREDWGLPHRTPLWPVWARGQCRVLRVSVGVGSHECSAWPQWEGSRPPSFSRGCLCFPFILC